jgi:alkylated DNA nucleotide flippase Atl1
MRLIVPSRPGAGAQAGRMTGVTSAARRRPAPGRDVREDAGAGLPTPYAEAVLDLVERIPRGRVMAYGDIAAALQQGGGPRQVGTVMARWGSDVPWHRVVKSDGGLPAGHEREALRRHRLEGTPLRGDRIDMRAARWWPDDAPPA